MKGKKITNLWISQNCQEMNFWLFRNSVVSAFAYWVIKQSPYLIPKKIKSVLNSFKKYIEIYFNKPDAIDGMVEFSYKELQWMLSEKQFESIPEIEKLNHSKKESGLAFNSVSRYHKMKQDYDFVDLGALAKNVFYMIIKEYLIE